MDFIILCDIVNLIWFQSNLTTYLCNYYLYIVKYISVDSQRVKHNLELSLFLSLIRYSSVGYSEVQTEWLDLKHLCQSELKCYVFQMYHVHTTQVNNTKNLLDVVKLKRKVEETASQRNQGQKSNVDIEKRLKRKMP